MANDEVKVDDIEDADDNVPDIQDTDTTDWKAEALKAQEESRKNAGIAKRNATRLKKLKEGKKEEAPNTKIENKQGFDYGEMAYLEAKGVEEEFYPIVLEAMKATGKALKDAVASKYVQSELKELRDEKASKEAIPSGSKRSTSSTIDTVDYWIAKGELPKDNPELARKVVAEKRNRMTNKNMFTNRSVV